MFNFRIITLQNGNEVIDTSLSTPYKALTPSAFIHYLEWDNALYMMERGKRKTERKIRFLEKIFKKGKEA